MEYYLGGRQGEHIWTGSQMDTYKALNYTQILTLGVMESLLVYQTFPELINIIVLEQNDMMDCIDRNKDNYKYLEDPAITGMWQEKTGRFGCIKTEKYLEGIPIWKVRINHLWGGHATPMGPRWTLAISDIDSNRPGEGNYFLGTSLSLRQAYPFFGIKLRAFRLLGRAALYQTSSSKGAETSSIYSRQITLILHRRT